MKEATGAFRKNPQRKAIEAPKANGKEPDIPDGLCDIAKAKWRDLVSDLQLNGVLSSDTREMLTAYCTIYAKWMAARAKVEETGLAIESFDKHGNLVITKNPYVSEMHKFRDQLNRMLPEFGLTPASRQKLRSMNLDEKKEDPFAKIMARMAQN